MISVKRFIYVNKVSPEAHIKELSVCHSRFWFSYIFKYNFSFYCYCLFSIDREIVFHKNDTNIEERINLSSYSLSLKMSINLNFPSHNFTKRTYSTMFRCLRTQRFQKFTLAKHEF